jgi:hypothetical protein
LSEQPGIFKRLLIKLGLAQINSGKGSVQAQRIHGNVTIVNITQSLMPRFATLPRTTPEQKRVLRMLDSLVNRITVLDFMEREFGTRMVIELKPAQVYRVQKYIEVILIKTKGKT